MVRFTDEIEPDPAAADRYDRMMPIYADAYRAMQPFYDRLDSI
jgi:xylulokinase